MNRWKYSALFTSALLLSAGCASKYPSPYGDGAGGLYEWNVLLHRNDLDGWKVFPESKSADQPTWSVKDGVLNCAGTPVGYLATEKKFQDFELEVEWRFLSEKGAGNSGVLLLVQDKDEVWPRSMEAQLESRHAGDIWNIGDFPAKVDAARTQGRRTERRGACAEKPLNDWNRYRIVCAGGRLELYVNGELQNVATDVGNLPGRIALQSEGSFIQFRNIRIRSVTANAAAAVPTN